MQISVIIPVYNAAVFVQKAVESALQQAETAEIILVEDASTDNSLEVCQRLAQQYTKVKLFQFSDGINRGVSAARNLGIKKAQCDLIAFLDADDFYLPHRFVRTIKLFTTNPNLMAVYAPIRFYWEQENERALHLKHNAGVEVVDFRQPTDQSFFSAFLLGEHGYISLDGLTIRRGLVAVIGDFDTALRQTQDTDFILRLAADDRIARTTDEQAVTMARVHPNRRVYDSKKAYYYNRLLFQKWLRLATINNWETIVNRFLLRRTLEVEFLAKHANTQREKKVLFRLGFKAIRLGYYLIKYPMLIKKIC